MTVAVALLLVVLGTVHARRRRAALDTGGGAEAWPCVVARAASGARPADRHIAARALDALADSLGDGFERAIALIMDCKGKLITCGLGKSGHVGRKVAATFASSGTTAIFLHLAEAIHGDLGMAELRERRARRIRG